MAATTPAPSEPIRILYMRTPGIQWEGSRCSMLSAGGNGPGYACSFEERRNGVLVSKKLREGEIRTLVPWPYVQQVDYGVPPVKQ